MQATVGLHVCIAVDDGMLITTCSVCCVQLTEHIFCLQPCMVFAGEQFENDPDFKLAKSMLLDMFRGRVVEKINLKVQAFTKLHLQCCKDDTQ